MQEQLSTRDQAIIEWRESAKVLARAKEKELELRKNALKECFDYEDDDREGTQNLELGKGFKLKAVFKLNRTLDKDVDKVNEVLDEIEKMDSEGKFISERVVKFKPSLDKKEYDGMDEKYKEVLNEVLTMKPATPSLTFVEPKSK